MLTILCQNVPMPTYLSLSGSELGIALTGQLTRLLLIGEMCRDICLEIGDPKALGTHLAYLEAIQEMARQTEGLIAFLCQDSGITWADMALQVNQLRRSDITRQALHRRLSEYGSEVFEQSKSEYTDNISVINGVGDINFPKRIETQKIIRTRMKRRGFF